ncbi:MAG: M15 family metallopeptidase [Clostridiales bacterium]|jgi:hypothetical protein|nr:M15 family metallopeptidase [Clostridiales bacterium]
MIIKNTLLPLWLAALLTLRGAAVPAFERAAAMAAEAVSPVFRVAEIDAAARARIEGVSWKAGCPVPLADLRLVTVTYADFERRIHTGELVAHKKVADELADIFRELYEAGFPIERVELVDNYGGDDRLSMGANNTSAFNYRTVSGSANLSKHAYGLAIDINPIQNPYTEGRGSYVSPPEGRAYLDRGDVRPGMVVPGGAAHAAFTSRGWFWGGNWKTTIDYQHFQKVVDLE